MCDVCVSCAPIHRCFPLGLQVPATEVMPPLSDWKLPESDCFSLPKTGDPNLETALPCLVWASYSSKQRQDSGTQRGLLPVLSFLGLFPDRQLVHEIVASPSHKEIGRQGSELARSYSLVHTPKSAGYLMEAFLCLLSPQCFTLEEQFSHTARACLWTLLRCCRCGLGFGVSRSTDSCSPRTRDEESGRKAKQKSLVCPESCNLKHREEGLRRGVAMSEPLGFQPSAGRAVSAQDFVPDGSDPYSPSVWCGASGAT